jgi:hypothetical protein
VAFSPLSGTKGVNAGFLSRLEALRRALPNNLGAQIGVRSAYRSPEYQAGLFKRAVQKYGSVAAARKWVAPPGRSQHGMGNAIDLTYGSQAAMRAAHQYAPQFGLTFPMSYENWHIEPAEARGGKGAAQTRGFAVDNSGDNLVPAGTGAPAAPGGLASAFDGISLGGGSAGYEESGGSGGFGGAGGGAGGGAAYEGLTGSDLGVEPPPLDLQVPQAAPDPEALAPTETAAPVLNQLANLFTLPTIGQAGRAPPGTDTMPGGLPGQAKQLRRRRA